MRSLYSVLAIGLMLLSGHVSAKSAYQVLFLEEVEQQDVPSAVYYQLQDDEDDEDDKNRYSPVKPDYRPNSSTVLFIKEGLTVQNSLYSFEPSARLEVGALNSHHGRFAVGADGGVILTNYKMDSAAMPHIGAYASYGVGGFVRIEGKYYRVFNQDEVADFAGRSNYKFDAAAVFPVRDGVDLRVSAAFDRGGLFGLPRAGFTIVPSDLFSPAD